MEPNDLSHIFANADLDEAQDNHDAMPFEAKLHLGRVFAHKAGVGPDPGVYNGPPVRSSEDSDLQFGLAQQQRQESISALAGGGPPIQPAMNQELPKVIRKTAGIPETGVDRFVPPAPVKQAKPPKAVEGLGGIS